MRQTTVTLLAALALVLFAAWFFKTHEKIARDQYVGYSGEARVNNFFASDLLLNELGIEADSVSSLTPSDWLPETDDTLVSPLSTTFAISVERDLLTMWVADGGHLVLLPPKEESIIASEFLDYVGFPLIQIELDEEEEEEDSADDSGDEAEAETYEYIVDLDSTYYRIDISDEEFSGALLSDDQGVVAARQEWGAGYVTMIADSKYFTNDAIRESDHALLLLDSVAGYVKPGKVWFIYDASFASLWQRIWNTAPYVVISFAILLVLWLWSVMPKFGPSVRPDPPVRRSIIEHIKAAGNFVWRNDGARTLATCSTAAVMHEAESRHPGIKRLPANGQARQIARMTGLPEQTILEVLTNQDEPRHREFTHNMQALQRIRKEL